MAVFWPRSELSSDTDSIGASILDFTTSRTVRNKSLLFVNHQVYSTYFVIAPCTKRGIEISGEAGGYFQCVNFVLTRDEG